MKTTTINLNEIMDEADGELDLIPYFVKLALIEQGIPVTIDPEDIRNTDFETDFGTLTMSLDVETMVMEFYYETGKS